jgi:hypothetical protein
MNLKFTYFTSVKDGRLQKHITNAIRNDLSTFEGKRIVITISKAKSQRTVLQNSLYWVYVTMIANELGYDKNEMHEVIKFKFMKCEKVNEKTGEVMQYLKSTTDLSKMDFVDLINDLQRWSAESLGIVLPEPGQQIEIF